MKNKKRKIIEKLIIVLLLLLIAAFIYGFYIMFLSPKNNVEIRDERNIEKVNPEDIKNIDTSSEINIEKPKENVPLIKTKEAEIKKKEKSVWRKGYSYGRRSRCKENAKRGEIREVKKIDSTGQEYILEEIFFCMYYPETKKTIEWVKLEGINEVEGVKYAYIYWQKEEDEDKIMLEIPIEEKNKNKKSKIKKLNEKEKELLEKILEENKKKNNIEKTENEDILTRFTKVYKDKLGWVKYMAIVFVIMASIWIIEYINLERKKRAWEEDIKNIDTSSEIFFGIPKTQAVVSNSVIKRIFWRAFFKGILILILLLYVKSYLFEKGFSELKEGAEKIWQLLRQLI